MNFDYIEQLIERYFAAETSLQEEHILRAFFEQDEIPASLQQWKPFFVGQGSLANAHLDEHFDERLLALADEVHVQARRIPLTMRLRPLAKVAALIAVAVLFGTAIEHTTPSRIDRSQGATQQAEATVQQDELDPEEATPLDIKSAEAVPHETSDSTSILFPN